MAKLKKGSTIGEHLIVTNEDLSSIQTLLNNKANQTDVTQLFNEITNEKLINLSTNQFIEVDTLEKYPVGFSIMRVNLSVTNSWATETSGFLTVETINTGVTGIQRITRYNTSTTATMNIYERRYAGGNWGNWFNIVTSHSFSKIEGKETFLICSTSSATTSKTATRLADDVSFFSLEVGMSVKVKFANNNTSTSPTLNIHLSGAKPILNSDGTPFNKWSAGGVYTFVYDETSFILQGVSNETFIEHIDNKKNPHNVTSEMVNIIDRTSLDANTPPSDYPIGVTEFYETRTTQASTWRQALGLSSFKIGFRLIIKTDKVSPLSNTSAFGTATQTLIYMTSLGNDEGVLEAIYKRSIVYKKNEDGTYTYGWGDFVQQINANGGNMTGILTAQSNNSYNVRQMRNIILSKTIPTIEMLNDGDICLVYEE